MFELADGDLRKVVSRSNKIDDAWRLRVLHDVAVGIQQLHGQRIAHQDLKPSNVLVFDKDGKGAKIGDLGRASQRGLSIDHDQFVVAGHPNYAPPEQMFGLRPERWEDRREGCDIYHLGTLVTFLFSGITPTDHYLGSLPLNVRPNPWGGNGTCDYHSALPFLTAEFTVFLDKIASDLPKWASSQILKIVENACNPDYEKRGDPAARRRVGSPLGIETFVSRFDRLAKYAEIESRK
jgi:serine/threonine protein kinase